MCQRNKSKLKILPEIAAPAVPHLPGPTTAHTRNPYTFLENKQLIVNTLKSHNMEQISINPAAERNWFKTWFDTDYYHKLYSHRNDKEACAFIDALITKLQPNAGSSMLDLGCGAGRHSKYLAQKGFNVTGLDLSASSIQQAKRSENDFLKFTQYDMRIPFGKNKFDVVFNFFTSFGYFENEKENL